jgi:hypothetical protein
VLIFFDLVVDELTGTLGAVLGIVAKFEAIIDTFNSVECA